MTLFTKATSFDLLHLDRVRHKDEDGDLVAWASLPGLDTRARAPRHVLHRKPDGGSAEWSSPGGEVDLVSGSIHRRRMFEPAEPLVLRWAYLFRARARRAGAQVRFGLALGGAEDGPVGRSVLHPRLVGTTFRLRYDDDLLCFTESASVLAERARAGEFMSPSLADRADGFEVRSTITGVEVVTPVLRRDEWVQVQLVTARHAPVHAIDEIVPLLDLPAWGVMEALGVMEDGWRRAYPGGWDPLPPGRLGVDVPRKVRRSDAISDLGGMPTLLQRRVRAAARFSAREYERLALGRAPTSRRDVWFAYERDHWLYVHRIWNGTCAYVARFEPLPSGDVAWTELIVNDDPAQVAPELDETHLARVTGLLDGLAGRTSTGGAP